jgi:ribosomal-protein-alanine N-acetyltransferase
MINDSHFDKFPHLESERLLFRKFEIEDAVEIQAIRSDEMVMKFMDSNRHDTVQYSEKFVARNMEAYQNKEGLFWAIIDKASGEFAGDFSFWRLDRANCRGEIGYSLKPQFWGKGYMPEAMRVLLKFGFKGLNLHSIEANINPQNENSKSVLEKIGFQKEAYFRENYYYKEKFLDSEIYCLLENDLK